MSRRSTSACFRLCLRAITSSHLPSDGLATYLSAGRLPCVRIASLKTNRYRQHSIEPSMGSFVRDRIWNAGFANLRLSARVAAPSSRRHGNARAISSSGAAHVEASRDLRLKRNAGWQR